MTLFDFVCAVRFDRAIPVVVIGTFLIGNVAWLMRQKGLRDGFSRKLNHFLLSALSGVCLFGLPDESFVPTAVATSVLVLLIYAWSAKSSREVVSRVIRSNVRDRDGERGNFFVFLPLVPVRLRPTRLSLWSVRFMPRLPFAQWAWVMDLLSLSDFALGSGATQSTILCGVSETQNR